MKAKVDRQLCIGCALCSDLAPESFEMNDELKSVAKEETVVDEAKCKEATEACPVKAISLEPAS